jgi:hypothetical protein
LKQFIIGEGVARKPEYVLIPVRPETRDRLIKFGKKREKFDSIINRLMLERTKELEFPREHLTLEKVEEVLESDEGVPLEEFRARLGI